MCVRVRERESKREQGRERERESKREIVSLTIIFSESQGLGNQVDVLS